MSFDMHKKLFGITKKVDSSVLEQHLKNYPDSAYNLRGLLSVPERLDIVVTEENWHAFGQDLVKAIYECVQGDDENQDTISAGKEGVQKRARKVIRYFQPTEVVFPEDPWVDTLGKRTHNFVNSLPLRIGTFKPNRSIKIPYPVIKSTFGNKTYREILNYILRDKNEASRQRIISDIQSTVLGQINKEKDPGFVNANQHEKIFDKTFGQSFTGELQKNASEINLGDKPLKDHKVVMGIDENGDIEIQSSTDRILLEQLTPTKNFSDLTLSIKESSGLKDTILLYKELDHIGKRLENLPVEIANLQNSINTLEPAYTAWQKALAGANNNPSNAQFANLEMQSGIMYNSKLSNIQTQWRGIKARINAETTRIQSTANLDVSTANLDVFKDLVELSKLVDYGVSYYGVSSVLNNSSATNRQVNENIDKLITNLSQFPNITHQLKENIKKARPSVPLTRLLENVLEYAYNQTQTSAKEQAAWILDYADLKKTMLPEDVRKSAEDFFAQFSPKYLRTSVPENPKEFENAKQEFIDTLNLQGAELPDSPNTNLGDWVHFIERSIDKPVNPKKVAELLDILYSKVVDSRIPEPPTPTQIKNSKNWLNWLIKNWRIGGVGVVGGGVVAIYVFFGGRNDPGLKQPEAPEYIPPTTTQVQPKISPDKIEEINKINDAAASEYLIRQQLTELRRRKVLSTDPKEIQTIEEKIKEKQADLDDLTKQKQD